MCAHITRVQSRGSWWRFSKLEAYLRRVAPRTGAMCYAEYEATVTRPNNFSRKTQQQAFVRQKFRCASCGEPISALGESGRAAHRFGESAQAHHMRHVKHGGTNSVDNCVILCSSCHFSAHEGGNYRFGTVDGTAEDYPYFNG